MTEDTNAQNHNAEYSPANRPAPERFSEDKSAAAHEEDVARPNYNQDEPGRSSYDPTPPDATSESETAPSYEPNTQSYGPASSYENGGAYSAEPAYRTAPSYGTGERGHDAAAPGYDAAASGYSAAAPGYSATAPRYGTAAPGYNAGGLYGTAPHQLAYGDLVSEPLGAVNVARKRSRTGRLVLISAVTAALVGGGVGAGTVALFDNNNSNGVASAGLSVTTATAQSAAKIDGTVTAAAAKIQPSVVTINVTGNQESGTGSGVIIRSDGYILTNDHVVSVTGSSGSISVVTTDGQTASAKIVGVDAPDDLAVIQVSGLKNLTAASFAKSSDVKVGQAVVAIGAPLGLSDTVTSGIISNVARPVRSGDNDQAVFEALQTDAAINPGNSGGPLVDLNGNVVGINAAIATANSGGLSIPGQTTASGSIGIGFAIPSDEASRIASQLITTGTATHSVIGVSVQGASSSTGSSSSSGSGTATAGVVGATIAQVSANGPASSAGLQAGDVVTAVGSQRVEGADSLIAAIRSHAPGEAVTITFKRGGAAQTAKVTLGTSTT